LKGGINLKVLLLWLILITIANSAAGYCITFDFNGPDDSGEQILDSYDGSGLVHGFDACFDVPNEEDSPETGYGFGSAGFRITIKHPRLSSFVMPDILWESEITIHDSQSENPDWDLRNFTSRYGDTAKNVTFGHMDVQGHTASYFLCEEPVVESDSYGRQYEICYGMGGISFLIDPQATFTMLLRNNRNKRPIANTPHEFIRIFKSINISKLTGENPRYLKNLGNSLFKQGDYEGAIAAYDKIANYNVYYGLRCAVNYESGDVLDNKGIALAKLGRDNEALAWFDSHKPKSADAWHIYGLLLESMNLIPQGEYAFAQEQEIRKEGE